MEIPIKRFNIPRRNRTLSDKEQGLYDKYIVLRTDGSSGKGDKHENCNYFVLDLNHDKHAIAALDAYAESARLEYPQLSEDIRHIIENIGGVKINIKIGD